MSQFNGTDYDDLFPRTKAEITIPSITTLNKFSNKTNADEILSQLGDYNLYWWKRRTSRREYSIFKELPTNGSVIRDGSDREIYDIPYSSDALVDGNGNIQLLNPIIKRLNENNYLESEIFRGKYYTEIGIYGGRTSYYMEYDSIITKGGNWNYLTRTGYINSSKTRRMFTALETKTGEWETLQSVNRNAYPDSGIVNGYEYEFLDIPFKNFVIPTRIEFGSYTGTGSYDETNPNILSFSFVPKLVKIYAEIHQNGDTHTAEIVTGYLTEVYKTYVFGEGNNIKKSADLKTIYWYSTSSPLFQFNEIATPYKYIAIG